VVVEEDEEEEEDVDVPTVEEVERDEVEEVEVLAVVETDVELMVTLPAALAMSLLNWFVLLLSDASSLKVLPAYSAMRKIDVTQRMAMSPMIMPSSTVPCPRCWNTRFMAPP